MKKTLHTICARCYAVAQTRSMWGVQARDPITPGQDETCCWCQAAIDFLPVHKAYRARGFHALVAIRPPPACRGHGGVRAILPPDPRAEKDVEV